MKKRIIVSMVVFMSLGTVTAQEWETDFAKAKEIATKEHKAIVLVFQGSDWCAPCIKLDRVVWSTDVFKNYAKDHYVMLKADFPRKKSNKLPREQREANAKLAETYNTSGIFPLVVIVDRTGKVLGQTGYKKATPEEYIKDLNTFIK